MENIEFFYFLQEINNYKRKDYLKKTTVSKILGTI
jgi:hypothetical protein